MIHPPWGERIFAADTTSATVSPTKKVRHSENNVFGFIILHHHFRLKILITIQVSKKPV